MTNSENPYGQSNDQFGQPNNPFSQSAIDHSQASEYPNKPAGSLATGSLAQQARGKQLNSARWILIVIGILSSAVNIYFVLNAESIIDDAIRKEGVDPRQVDQKFIDQAVTMTKVINGAGAAIGLTFIIMGIIIYSFPVPITILSLVLYCGSIAIFGMIDPMTLARGFIIKIFVIVALSKSIGTAFEYQKANGK